MSLFYLLREELGKRKKAFLWLGALVLANGALFLGVTHRLANKQERLARERESLGLELQQKQQELASLAEAESLVARNADAVERFWSEVVKQRAPGLTEAWDEIDRLASETNVLKGRTGFSREVLEVGLEQITATMPLEGDYFDLVRFINRLERSERFFLVQEVRLSHRESEQGRIRLDCSVAFFLKAEAPTGATAGGP